MVAMLRRRGAHDRHDHARQPLRPRARRSPTDDLKLLEALANNASVALQYDRLEQAVTQLRALQEQLHHQAYHDPLTELPNRSLFMERVRAGARATPGDHVAVLFIDVDDFKTVNDSLGHGVGDALLVSVAGRLRRLRAPAGHRGAARRRRVRGDAARRRGSDRVGPHGSPTRILEAFELPVRRGRRARLGASERRHRLEPRRSTATREQLIRNADVAMYQAKSQGKGRFEVFEPAMADAIVRRHGLKEELGKAVEREQIVVEYQPIVELETGRDRRRRGARALGAPGARPRLAVASSCRSPRRPA